MTGRINNDEERCYCSFCGKPSDKVRKLISSPNENSYICDECIELCNELLEEDFDDYVGEAVDGINLYKPMKIKELLDEYVVGQDEAKRNCTSRFQPGFQTTLARGEGSTSFVNDHQFSRPPTVSIHCPLSVCQRCTFCT